MSLQNTYSVEPFVGSSKSALRPGEVAGQLEAVLNRSARSDGTLAAIGAVSIRVEPGCLGGLFGKSAKWTHHDQVIVGLGRATAAGAASALSTESDAASAVENAGALSPPIPAPPVVVPETQTPAFSATTAVFNSATSNVQLPNQVVATVTRFWHGLSKNARIAFAACGTIAIGLILYFAMQGPEVAPQVVRSPPAPPPSTPRQDARSATQPQAMRPRADPRTPTVAQGGIDQPIVRKGDRWITEVIDHQDARLNYQSERVVQEAGNGRITTTVRTLKRNYVRTIEYDAQWSLLSSRIPTGAVTSYAPPLPYLSFPAAPGKSWQARVAESMPTGATRVHEVRGTIVGWETVTVPAGTFKGLKIVLTDEISEDGRLVHRGEDTSWYVPEVRRSVKTEEASFTPSNGERRRRTISLLEYSLQ